MDTGTQRLLYAKIQRLKALEKKLRDVCSRNVPCILNEDGFFARVSGPDGGQRVSTAFWSGTKEWRLKNVFPRNAVRQLQLLETLFLPKVPKDALLCDLACGCGDFTLPVAPHVRFVEGFDVSPGMIEKVRAAAHTADVRNVRFSVANAMEMIFSTTYDAFMMLGLLTYVMRDEQARNIIASVHKNLIPGARMAIKDSLTVHAKDIYRYDGNYAAIYRSQERYMTLYHPWFRFERAARISKPDANGYFSFFGVLQRQEV